MLHVNKRLQLLCLWWCVFLRAVLRTAKSKHLELLVWTAASEFPRCSWPDTGKDPDPSVWLTSPLGPARLPETPHEGLLQGREPWTHTQKSIIQPTWLLSPLCENERHDSAVSDPLLSVTAPFHPRCRSPTYSTLELHLLTLDHSKLLQSGCSGDLWRSWNKIIISVNQTIT